MEGTGDRLVVRPDAQGVTAPALAEREVIWDEGVRAR